MNRLIVQISDLHITEAPALYERVDQRARLQTVIDLIKSAELRPDVILLSGDLADTGEPSAYRALRELVEPAAEELGAAIVYIPGNHDSSDVLERALFDREPDGKPLDQVVMAGGLRLVALDSTTLAGHHGELTDEQLDWLRGVLSEPAEEGTIIAIHHPPIASPVRLLSSLLLHEPERLAEVVAGTDVRMIVSGHTHHISCGLLGGVPVWVAPANVYYSDVMAAGGKFGARMGGGFTRIDVIDGVPVATAIPFDDGSAPLYEHDTDDLLALAESYPRG